jgi:hypothetical protein
MLADGFQVIVHQVIVFTGQGIEIAVLAFAATEGDMNINTKGRFVVAGKNGHGEPPKV